MLAGWPGWDFRTVIYLLVGFWWCKIKHTDANVVVITFNHRCVNVNVELVQVIYKLLSLTDGMQIFTEVIKLIRLCLTISLSSATAKQSFSTLRRLKTFTRSSMKASRLTHLALLHVHQDHTDKLDLNDLCTTFVSSNERRQGVFRK